MELDGETVLRAKPVIGYLHTGMEKTGEELTYVQGVHQRDPHGLRVAAVATSWCSRWRSSACSTSRCPSAPTWIRMLLVELNRIASHLLFQATNGMDLGAVSMMHLRLARARAHAAAAREHHRPADEPQLHPARWCRGRPPRRLAARRRSSCATRSSAGVGEYDTLLSENPIWRERTVGVGVITTRAGLALGATGPILRSTGFAWDLRKAQPYLAYDDVDFDVIYTRERRRLRPLPDPALRDPRVGQDRAPVRGAHARRRLPRAGPQDHAAAADAHRRVDGSAHPPLQALHRRLPRAAGRDLRRRRVATR